MKYKIGDLLVSRYRIGVVIGVSTQEYQSPESGIIGIENFYTLGSAQRGDLSSNVNEKDVLGKLELVKET